MTDRSAGGGHRAASAHTNSHKQRAHAALRSFKREDAHQAWDCSKQPIISKDIEMLANRDYYTHTHMHIHTKHTTPCSKPPNV